MQVKNALPPGRTQHTVTHDEASGTAIVFGGYSSAQGHLMDVWVLHPGRGEAWQPADHGVFPVKRRGHVAQIIGHSLWVHGGTNKDGVLGDVSVLDLHTWEWKEVRFPVPTTV